MNTVKALVHCEGFSTSTRTYKGKTGVGAEVTFSFNYHNDKPEHINYEYFDATPCGNITMQIDNPEALKRFRAGSDYELLLREIDPQEKQ